MKRTYLYILLVFLLPITRSAAQGLIINEVSQGSSGTKEFVEFLVVGSIGQTTGTVDIRDWIIDDNNGSFRLSDSSAPGLASGHGRFAPNDTLAAVPIGALIVIYNVADVNPIWNFVLTDSNGAHIAHIENGGMLYIIPGTSTLLRACEDFPNSTNPGYAYVNSTIPPTSSNWNDGFGFTNNGDAIQVRKPDGTFYHAFGFSTPTQSNVFTMFPTFSDVNLPSFNAYTGNAAGKVTYLDCGSWYYATSYLTGNATTSAATTAETAGLPNDTNNANMIAHIKDGLFNYALLSVDTVCSAILPLRLISFNASIKNDIVVLKWQTVKGYKPLFEIERSVDQQRWIPFHTIQANEIGMYLEIDSHPFNGKSFYRLKMTEENTSVYYSDIALINNMSVNGAYAVYPNPAKDWLHVVVNSDVDYMLYNNLGVKVKYGIVSALHYTISFSDILPGFYYLILKDSKGTCQNMTVYKQ